MPASGIANALTAYVTFDLSFHGYDKVLHVVTDLPINPKSDGFDGSKLRALNLAIGKIMVREGFGAVKLRSKV